MNGVNCIRGVHSLFFCFDVELLTFTPIYFVGTKLTQRVPACAAMIPF